MEFKQIGKLTIIIVVSFLAVMGSYGLGYNQGWDGCIQAIEKIQKIQEEIKEKQWENLREQMKGRKKRRVMDTSTKIC